MPRTAPPTERLRRLTGLAGAAAAAGCGAALNDAVGRHVRSGGENDETWRAAWLTLDELMERTREPHRCSDAEIKAFANQLAWRHTNGQTTFGADVCRRVWDLIAATKHPAAVGSLLLDGSPIAVELARHAIVERWPIRSKEARRRGWATTGDIPPIVGARCRGTRRSPLADLLCGVDVHTPVTLALLASAGVTPTEEFAELVADGRIRVEAAPDCTFALEDGPEYAMALTFIAAVSADAQIDAALIGRAEDCVSYHLNEGDTYSTVLPATWRRGDLAVTRRAAAALVRLAREGPCRAAGAAHGWFLRSVAVVDDTDLRDVARALRPRGVFEVALHADDSTPPSSVRRLIATIADPAATLSWPHDDPARSAALIAACVPGIVPGVVAADGTVTPVVQQLLLRIVDAAGRDADGFALLAGLAESWAGTVDELCGTLARLRRT